MNVLMLARWLPRPRRHEEARREYRFARQLLGRHRLTLAFTTDETDLALPVAMLRAEFGALEFVVVRRGWRELSAAVRVVSGESRSVAYFRSEALRARLDQLVAEQHFDVAYVSSSSMMPYAVGLDPRLPVIADFGELDSEWWAQQAGSRSFPAANFCRAEAARLRSAEVAAAARAAHCIVATPEAARTLAGSVPGATITVIPDGVDQDHFAPLLRRSEDRTVAIVGRLDSSASVEALARFCLTTVPTVRAKLPGVDFLVASPTAPASARGLAEIAKVEIMTALDDVRPVLQRAMLAVAPLPQGRQRADGVVEAMLTGLPVVATSGAVDRLGAVPGFDLLVQDNPTAFADQVVHLLRSPVRRGDLATRGQAFARARCSWEASTSRLAETIEASVPR
jgi:glycosyltransferase involved in cell wall biosynthesis